MFPIDPSTDIRFTAVIDEFRAAAADRAVERPILIQGENVIQRALRPDLGLLAADPLSGILDDLAVGGDAFTCEHTPPVDGGRLNDQPETRVSRINGWSIFSHCWTTTLKLVVRGAFLL